MIVAEVVCRTLESLGADTVFGLPGSQNVALFEALRMSRLRTVVAVHELGASFMANGYARASGRPGVLTTIPGPGFTYALTGLAEAFLDSTPVLWVLGGPATGPGRRFQLQALDQRAMVAPVAKRIFDVPDASAVEGTIRRAFSLCQDGEPGPVVVQIPPRLLAAETLLTGEAEAPAPAGPPSVVAEVARRLRQAQRPLVYVGQGAAGAHHDLGRLLDALGAPLVTTTSARGVIAEDDPRVLCFDRRDTAVLNELIESADLVLVLGCKFSHNGAHGFRLQLPAERLIQVDASPEVLGANYDAALTIEADVPTFVRAVLDEGLSASTWTPQDRRSWKERAAGAVGQGREPRVRGSRPSTPAAFFETLRTVMPREAALVLDSGLHQMLARRHFPVLCPRGLILPTDLQAMGFALPAAIGARLARPETPVVALLGDGGFAMSGLELLTAVRDRIALTAIVFNDGRYGLIHKQQVGTYGHSHGTELRNPNIRSLTESVGARYALFSDISERDLGTSIRDENVTVIEVELADPSQHRLRRVGASFAGRLKRWLRREQGGPPR